MKHGDLYRAGDEFNREPWYHCAKCGSAHGRDIAGCDGLRADPYGVPTGSVPRVSQLAKDANTDAALARLDALHREPASTGMSARPADPVAEAIEQYLLMERKAKAWDSWVAKARTMNGATMEGFPLLDYLEALVHPAGRTAP